MKISTHFNPADYSPWFKAKSPPTQPGWYECSGFRFNGILHLKFDGQNWLYFGPKHTDSAFPSFGAHKTDRWRGINKPKVLGKSTWKKVEHLTGKRFGLLTALVHEYQTHHGAFWMFACDCGTKRVAQAKWVISGNTASCGCNQYKRSPVSVTRPWPSKA